MRHTAKVGSTIQRMIHHEDTEAIFGWIISRQTHIRFALHIFSRDLICVLSFLINSLQARLHQFSQFCQSGLGLTAIEQCPPSLDSKRLIAFVSDGCATPQRLAARVKLPSSHRDRKYRTSCISTIHPGFSHGVIDVPNRRGLRVDLTMKLLDRKCIRLRGNGRSFSVRN